MKKGRKRRRKRRRRTERKKRERENQIMHLREWVLVTLVVVPG